MPIRVQNDLPARSELEKENIFVMDENPRAGAGYPSAADSDPESDADQAGYGDTAVSRDVQHSAADRYYTDAYLEPYVKEHFVSSSE